MTRKPRVTWPLLVLSKGTKVPDFRYNPRGFKDAQPRTLEFIETIIRSGQGLAASCIVFPGDGDDTHCVVLDVDIRNGGDINSIPPDLYDPAWVVTSGRRDGGRHIYFRTARLSDEFRKTDEGVDVKHLDAGYVLIPPTAHPDTGWPYEWAMGHPPEGLPPVFPSELEERFLRPVGDIKREREYRTTNRPDAPYVLGTSPGVLYRIFAAAELTYEHVLPVGMTPVICPNSSEHTSASPPSATALLPTRDGDGTFRCLHSHCVEKLNSRRRVLKYIFARSTAARNAVRRDDPLWIQRLLPPRT